MKALYSERHGYIKPSDIVIRKSMPDSVVNAISTCVSLLEHELENDDDRKYFSIQDVPYYDLSYYKLKAAFWTEFQNRKYADLHYGEDPILDYIDNVTVKWYQKLDCVEFLIEYMQSNFDDSSYHDTIQNFIKRLNDNFVRLRYGYRIIDGNCTDITSDEEIAAITDAISEEGSVQVHLSKALELYSKRPMPDYRNSIKESISAVEAYCREQTGQNLLGHALNQLTSDAIHPMLKTAFNNLYAYTNQKDTGIRHALMEDTSSYTPTSDEAYFMIVSCSAFINYLRKKLG